jgi:hypothetical protein
VEITLPQLQIGVPRTTPNRQAYSLRLGAEGCSSREHEVFIKRLFWLAVLAALILAFLFDIHAAAQSNKQAPPGSGETAYSIHSQ